MAQDAAATPRSASAGTALGAVVWILVQLLPDEQLLAWGWRIVFFSSAFVTLAAYILRQKLRDAPVFEQAKQERDRRLADQERVHGRSPTVLPYVPAAAT